MNREEYLKGELIPGVSYLITDDHIKIETEDTIYTEAHRPCFISHKKAIAALNALKRECKDRGVKLRGYKLSKEKLRDLRESYDDSYNKQINLYNKMQEIALRISEDRLHYGTCNDELLQEIGEVEDEKNKLTNLNTDYSEYVRLYFKVEAMLEDVKESSDIIRITI